MHNVLHLSKNVQILFVFFVVFLINIKFFFLVKEVYDEILVLWKHFVQLLPSFLQFVQFFKFFVRFDYVKASPEAVFVETERQVTVGIHLQEFNALLFVGVLFYACIS